MPERNRSYTADVVIIGAGLAGLVTALHLLDTDLTILMIDRDRSERIGGLAKESFGGVMAVGTDLQKKTGIPDSPEIAWQDWLRVAAFSPEDRWPMAWAKTYVEQSDAAIYQWLKTRGVRFLPVVNWPERGLFQPANTLPRWHIAWGCGHRIVSSVLDAIAAHPKKKNLSFRFQHKVTALSSANKQITGCTGTLENASGCFSATADRVVLAAGGFCGGNLSRVRRLWPPALGTPPERLLNGAHRFADGTIHDAAAEKGASLDHLNRQWHYAAGIHSPGDRSRRQDRGISLVPPKSALWLNARGERIGPVPLMGSMDTRYLVERLSMEKEDHSWLVLNRKIAERELAVSGCDYMTAFRNRKLLQMIKELVFGNARLVATLTKEARDIVTAPTLRGLYERMQQLEPDVPIDFEKMTAHIRAYDAQITRGPALFTDDQLRRIAICAQYRGDRLRTCRFQRIVDPKAGPLIAIRTFLLTRKSLGGIRTDLKSRVLSPSDEPIPGLFAAGEAAGFGGGNLHGRGSLEGTFLGGCILTAQAAADAIARGYG